MAAVQRLQSPYRDVSVTAQMAQEGAGRGCPICGTQPESRRATYCSQRCRMVAFRRRNGHRQMAREFVVAHPSKPSREHVVFECTGCEARYLGDQRCSECNRFCRRLGPGGQCPGCDDIVTVAELLQS
jgi:hypothetical protein